MAKSKYECKNGGKGQPLCYKVERVKRGKKEGYITVFKFNFANLKRESYSGTRPERETCMMTPDAFQATIRKSKAKAARVGHKCLASITKVMNAKHGLKLP